MPHRADLNLSRQTCNARTQTVDTNPPFRNAWKKKQFRIVPAASLYEPCHETGKPIRFSRRALQSSLALSGIRAGKNPFAQEVDKHPQLAG